MDESDKLSAEDVARVKKYLSSGFNKTERKPFRGWTLLAIIWAVVTALGVASWFIGRQYGFL
jgi:hypothetical protein